MTKPLPALLFALTLGAAPLAAHAQTDTRDAPSGVLSLSAQASAQVPQDVVTITLFYEEASADPASLAAALNQHADAALRTAKGVAGVNASSGQFSVYPQTDRDGKLSGWRGRTEVVLESRDFAAASKLAGELAPGMQIGGVQFSLSPGAQRAAEQKLSGEAIAGFRDEAASAVRAFGYDRYTIRDVTLGRAGVPPRPLAMFAARAAKAEAAAPLPIEGGTSTVTVTVSGSVQMK